VTGGAGAHHVVEAVAAHLSRVAIGWPGGATASTSVSDDEGASGSSGGGGGSARGRGGGK